MRLSLFLPIHPAGPRPVENPAAWSADEQDMQDLLYLFTDEHSHGAQWKNLTTGLLNSNNIILSIESLLSMVAMRHGEYRQNF